MLLLNGEIVNSEKIPLDHGFYFGRGLFETMLVKHKPLFLKEHLERINHGLSLIGVDKVITQNKVLEAVKKLHCDNCVLKLVVTEKNVLFTTRENNYSQNLYEKGFKVKISSVKRNESSPLTYLKSLNYLENILEHEKCVDEGFNEVLFFNTENKLAEGSTANIFFLRNERVYTPSSECGLLEGTIRKFVIDNFEVIEGKFSRKDLLGADSAFLTNSVMGIMKISAIEHKNLNGNSVIEKINKVYQEYISHK